MEGAREIQSEHSENEENEASMHEASTLINQNIAAPTVQLKAAA